MVSPLSVPPAKDYGDPRNKIHEVEEHLREADSTKGGLISDEMRRVVCMKVFFEELRFFVRRRGLHNDRLSHGELRASLMERSPRSMQEPDREGEEAPGIWMELSTGDRAWVDAGHLSAPPKGGQGKAKGKGIGQYKGKGKGTFAAPGKPQGKGNRCGKEGHKANDCEEKTKRPK